MITVLAALRHLMGGNGTLHPLVAQIAIICLVEQKKK